MADNPTFPTLQDIVKSSSIGGGADKSSKASEVMERLQEWGVPPAPLTPVGNSQLPPFSGRYTAPYPYQFAGIVNSLSRVYQWTFDNAITDSRLNAAIMRDDYIIYPAINKRIRPVAQLDWELEPVDPTNQRLKSNAEKITAIMKRIPRFQQLRKWLLEAIFFGRSAVQVTTAWDYSTGDKNLIINGWEPTHPDSIVFRFDNVPGILVNSVEFIGEKTITPRGLCHFFTPDENEWLYVHEFEPEAVDFFNPIRAGAVKGLGYRGRLYWIWWLREKLTSILMDYCEKCATGYTIFYYNQSNPSSQAAMQTAANNQIGNNVFLIPRSEDHTRSAEGIEIIPTNMQGAQFLSNLWQYLNSLMQDAILGEQGTTQSMPGGIGSTAADQHGITADERVKYDAVDVEYPMQMMVNALNRWNCPNDPPPTFKHLADKRNPEEFLQACQFAYEMGLSISENQVRDVLGLPTPLEGEPVLSKLSNMQPAGLNQPAGVDQQAPTGAAAQVQPQDGSDGQQTGDSSGESQQDAVNQGQQQSSFPPPQSSGQPVNIQLKKNKFPAKFVKNRYKTKG